MAVILISCMGYVGVEASATIGTAEGYMSYSYPVVENFNVISSAFIESFYNQSKGPLGD